MKKILIISYLMLGIMYFTNSQVYQCKNGHIWFYSHAAMEDITAHNNEVVSIINSTTGDIVFSVLIKSFKFKNAMMEEHFNEKYMESDKYPKSEFKGKITNLKDIDFKKDGVYEAKVKGKITIHGTTKDLEQTGKIEVKNGKLLVNSKFSVLTQDFTITIPDLVKEKIAKSIEVNVEMTYEQKK